MPKTKELKNKNELVEQENKKINKELDINDILEDPKIKELGEIVSQGTDKFWEIRNKFEEITNQQIEWRSKEVTKLNSKAEQIFDENRARRYKNNDVILDMYKNYQKSILNQIYNSKTKDERYKFYKELIQCKADMVKLIQDEENLNNQDKNEIIKFRNEQQHNLDKNVAEAKQEKANDMKIMAIGAITYVGLDWAKKYGPKVVEKVVKIFAKILK